MKFDSADIALNFLAFDLKSFDVRFYRRPIIGMDENERAQFFIREQSLDDNSGEKQKFAIVFDERENFEEVIHTSVNDLDLTKRYILEILTRRIAEIGITTFEESRDKYQRVYIPISACDEGTETIWLEPYYLKSAERFGLLVDYKFWVSQAYRERTGQHINRRILQLSGALDSRGNANKEFYQFRFGKIREFLHQFVEKLSPLQGDLNTFEISKNLAFLQAEFLSTKTYQFADGAESNSPWFGLKRSGPYELPPSHCKFQFVFRQDDRSFAINLWNGLTGKGSPTTFPGMESIFRLPFTNNNITGRKVDEFSVDVLTEIADEIVNTEGTVLPVFVTKSHETAEDDKLYYTIKHIFTKRNIPCQVVTKELIVNKTSLKYSLSNIALQMFAKCGGKPWIVKPAIRDCLIIGIGSSHKIRTVEDSSGRKRREIEKFLTYSVLTDSSGLFREIEILSQADNEVDHYTQLVAKLSKIISLAISEGTKEIVVHAPSKISKSRVWDKVFSGIPEDVKISILIVNSDHKFFGYDFSKNSLIPYESTYIGLSHYEFLVWFEGLQYQTSSLTKRIGAPVYINFWHSNTSAIADNPEYRKSLLQDCINLSGANWRGFNAKQLPVSIFYCQRIAEFLKNFEQNEFEPIEFENLRPWFL